uniref:CAC1H protein n=1 Tax=Haemonchus contortus TaxID=6289 RepID=A0A7I4XV04_HAECO
MSHIQLIAVFFLFLAMSQNSEIESRLFNEQSTSNNKNAIHSTDHRSAPEKASPASGNKEDKIDTTIFFPQHRKRHQNGHHHCRHVHHC